MRMKRHFDQLAHFRIRALFLASIWFLLFRSPPTAFAALYTDFSDSAIWTPQIYGTGPQLVNNVNGFTALIPADSVPSGSGPAPDTMSAGYVSTFLLQGDFTVDVDYALPEWP